MPKRLHLALLAAALACASAPSFSQDKKKDAPKVNAPAQKSDHAAHGHEGRMATQHAICIGCHGIPGYKTAYPEVYHVPKIAGQQQAYIVSALKAYKSGERSHPSMRGVAASLTDEDMASLAAYYGAAK
jgi:cytochrome c553